MWLYLVTAVINARSSKDPTLHTTGGAQPTGYLEPLPVQTDDHWAVYDSQHCGIDNNQQQLTANNIHDGY